MTDAPRISDAPLRERVAREMDADTDIWGHELGQSAINMGAASMAAARERSLRRADRAIRVCREHFAGVAEACASQFPACGVAVSAIRSEGEK